MVNGNISKITNKVRSSAARFAGKSGSKIDRERRLSREVEEASHEQTRHGRSVFDGGSPGNEIPSGKILLLFFDACTPAELPGAASPCAQCRVLIRAREERAINRARIYGSRSDLFRAVFNGVGPGEKCSLSKSVRAGCRVVGCAASEALPLGVHRKGMP